MKNFKFKVELKQVGSVVIKAKTEEEALKILLDSNIYDALDECSSSDEDIYVYQPEEVEVSTPAYNDVEEE